MIEVIDAAGARRALVAGRLACPSCGATLRPWGHTRDRAVATPHDTTQATATVRLDRSRCRSCQTTHVLLPAGLLPRRCYPLRVIGVALAAAGQGAGSRSAAKQLGVGVPASTVRSWLRRARANADALYRLGVQTVVALAPDMLAVTACTTPLGDALQALAAAVAATTARFAPDLPVVQL